jgi:DNA polymerase alpha subunit A
MTNALELLILKRKLMGPCWIKIEDASMSSAGISWARCEVVVEDPKKIRIFKDDEEDAPKDAPPLVVMSLNMKTVMNHQKHMNEIVAASAFVFSDRTSPSAFIIVIF